MDLLRDHPELRLFVLSDVRITGLRIGAGAYGSVEEVEIPGAICAAKKIHDVFQDRSEIPEADIRKASTAFVRECQLMSTLRHPHIVQFLGVCFFEGSRLPALVMERLLTSLHDLLDPEIDPPPPPDASKPFFPLSLKCSILHNVASGLAYLHQQTPPIIHRDLSARNILLNSGMVAKIADLGVARIVPRLRAAVTMSKAPGNIIYMPPEALEAKSEEDEQRSKYGMNIDVFSFGVVSIFTLSQTFPCNLLAPTYREGHQHIARTELQRRERYMRMIYSKLHKNHPLLQMIEKCLDFPEDRPSIHEVLHLLEQGKAENRDEQIEMNKLEYMQALHTHTKPPIKPRNHLQQLVEQNHQSYVQDVSELQQQLQSSVRERESIRHQLGTELNRAEEAMRREQQLNQEMRQQLQSSERERQRLEAELARAEETVRREQQEMRQREIINLQEKNQLEQQIQCLRQQETEKIELIEAKDRELAQVQQLNQQQPKEGENWTALQHLFTELDMAKEQIERMKEQEEIIVREKSQVEQKLHDYREQEMDPELVQAKNREIAQLQEQLRQQEQSSRREIGDLEHAREALVADFQKKLQKKALGQEELRIEVTDLETKLESSEALAADFQKMLEKRDSEQQSMTTKVADLECQLQSSEALVANFQKMLWKRDSEQETLRTKVVDLEKQLQSSEALATDLRKALQQKESEQQPPRAKVCAIQCHKKKTTPYAMTRGSATSDHQFAYFTYRNFTLVYRYEWITELWSELPPTLYRNSGLVIIDGQLTTVGGYDGSKFTNKLLTLQKNKWIKEYPPMKYARSLTAVLSTSCGRDYVIVIGGGENQWVAAVELLHVESKQWYQLPNLPQPLPYPSATLCGHLIHVVGEGGNGYWCSLQPLPSSKLFVMMPMTSVMQWTPLPRLSVESSTAATLCGQLMIFGGWRDGLPVNSIHQLVSGRWMKIGSMSSGGRDCLVVNQSPNRALIVGGWRESLHGVQVGNIVEECVVV